MAGICFCYYYYTVEVDFVKGKWVKDWTVLEAL
jgi:hypothetical protein